MHKTFNKHIPRPLGIAVIIIGFVIGILIGYKFFSPDISSSNKAGQQQFTHWIFPDSTPLVSPPKEFPAVKPPTAPPPQR